MGLNVEQSDHWYEWLIRLRHANDPTELESVSQETAQFAKRVLDAAQLSPGMTLLDVGTGDGLIAFAAIDRIGSALKVVFSDISAPLLKHVRMKAYDKNVLTQCTFFECSAENLDAVADASIDVVTTRSVLAYVTDKEKAMREFHRVLKPGGRISLAEPVMRYDAIASIALQLLPTPPEHGLEEFMQLLYRWKATQFPDTLERIEACPMTNYSEQDLVRYAQDCNFSDIHMELHGDAESFKKIPWEVFVGSSPHPLAPSLNQIFEDQFTRQERESFEAILRPVVETYGVVAHNRMVYLHAVKC